MKVKAVGDKDHIASTKTVAEKVVIKAAAATNKENNITTLHHGMVYPCHDAAMY